MAGENNVLHIPSTIQNIPSDWHWERLDEICQGIFDCPHSTPTIVDRGPYIARSQDIRYGVFRIEDAGRISEATYKERIARAEPRHGDLLYSREGTYFGIAAEVPSGYPGLSWTTHGAFETKSRKGQSSIPPILAQLTDFGTPHSWLSRWPDRYGWIRLIFLTIRGQMHVTLPPMLSEQHAIAQILGTLDDKIELNRRMNETLEGIARRFSSRGSWTSTLFAPKSQADIPG